MKAILSPSRFIDRYWMRIDKHGPYPGRKGKWQLTTRCWSWLGKTDRLGRGSLYGYGLASRLAWEIHHGCIPKGLCVCHKCDNYNCVNPGHLFLGTALKNARDKIEKGRGVNGSKHWAHKLVESQVTEIRNLAKTGVATKLIAKNFKITPGNTKRIISRRIWRHI